MTAIRIDGKEFAQGLRVRVTEEVVTLKAQQLRMQQLHSSTAWKTRPYRFFAFLSAPCCIWAGDWQDPEPGFSFKCMEAPSQRVSACGSRFAATPLASSN